MAMYSGGGGGGGGGRHRPRGGAKSNRNFAARDFRKDGSGGGGGGGAGGGAFFFLRYFVVSRARAGINSTPPPLKIQINPVVRAMTLVFRVSTSGDRSAMIIADVGSCCFACLRFGCVCFTVSLHRRIVFFFKRRLCRLCVEQVTAEAAQAGADTVVAADMRVVVDTVEAVGVGTGAGDTGVPAVEEAEATRAPTHGNVAMAAVTKIPTTARLPVQSNAGA